MKIGFVGLGKLGLPVATAIAWRGHDVIGYDVNPSRMDKTPKPEAEEGPIGASPDFNTYLADSTLQFGTLRQVVTHAEILFCAIQTPHDPRFDGSTMLSDEPVDFDYSFLKGAVAEIAALRKGMLPIPLVVISTVLPGTTHREIVPLLNPSVRLIYNPFFIAMGTVMRDFLHPEFVLLGSDDAEASYVVSQFYRTTLPQAPFRLMSIPSAELTKVLYNTYISTKIVLANAAMEICHKTPGADVDDVTGALKAAHKRLASPAYMDAGMGDGGGCHPRDNIALSWLAKQRGVSFDPFSSAIRAREQQSRWLADLAASYGLPIVIAGYAFKPGTNITTGSPALLLADQLINFKRQTVTLWDPYIDDVPFPMCDRPCVVVIGCRHEGFRLWSGSQLARGSAIIDPHRYVGPVVDGVTLVQVGVGK